MHAIEEWALSIAHVFRHEGAAAVVALRRAAVVLEAKNRQRAQYPEKNFPTHHKTRQPQTA